ncbi:hypothetical protein M0R04_10205 [Candidatus Dojkabacteria bacterium]|jgi:hypothetical protein|nr:hypothetical protein [Candidatus Dojkabacteria bacterium]
MQYLGENAIKSIAISEFKTPNNQEISEVEFESGIKELIPTNFLNQLITENSISNIDYKNNQYVIIVGTLLGVLSEYNIRISDIGRIIDKIVMSINQNIESAEAALWKKKKEDQTLLDVHKVITSNKVELKDILNS